MEAIRSSETSGTTQRTTRRHIPEEDTLHTNLPCELLTSSSWVCIETTFVQFLQNIMVPQFSSIIPSTGCHGLVARLCAKNVHLPVYISFSSGYAFSQFLLFFFPVISH
jgi:hypothetical protein